VKLGKTTGEAAVRERLGIPKDARRVLLFSESSHWDTNWLSTSEEYFEKRLEPIFDAVIAALEADPERVYGVESVFFLKLFWERHPEARERIARLVERRQMRLLSSSFTTPDTLLPHPEAILRDFLLGQQWLIASGLSAAPRTAYFPDNFGHSPHLPSLMRAVGVDAVALTRIDGMYFIAADFRRKSAFPLAGSTAELLQSDLKTLDFVWKDDDGAEVLCHWNAFTYFQGDMLAHAGIVRWNGHVAAIPWRTKAHIARRIDGFARQLEPLARTPYLLCPIGMDFNDPIVDLRGLLERYNRERYGTTGIWSVLAGLDDYFDLVRCHKDKLPTLQVDPNPYWMGFYASRPELKQRPTRIARSLVIAESVAAFAPPDAELEASLRDAWGRLVLINHHDAITGTSSDRVCHAEQRGWLSAAEAAAGRALTRAAMGACIEAPHDGSKKQLRSRRAAGVRVRRDRWHVHVATAHYELTFSRERGGCLTSFVVDGEEQLRGVGVDLMAFRDDGGLWRLGHEYAGGSFVEVDRASRRPAKIDVETFHDRVSVIISSELGGKPFSRTVTCRAGEPFVHVRVAGVAARRLTVTCRCELLEGASLMEMDTVGGRIERPHTRVHEPTFWSVPSLVSLVGASRSLHVGFEAPSAVSFSPTGTLEWIVARNAPKERAYGVLPVLAHPIGGTTDEEQTHRAALFVTPAAVVPREMRRALEDAWIPDAELPLKRWAGARTRCDDASMTFAAVKRADSGGGIIVRLVATESGGRTVRVGVACGEIFGAALCDARERDLEALPVEKGQAVVPIRARMTTVRLVVVRPS
jgi:hypothetical protein